MRHGTLTDFMGVHRLQNHGCCSGAGAYCWRAELGLHSSVAVTMRTLVQAPTAAHY